jgi:uncharacterized low-complexity protein
MKKILLSFVSILLLAAAILIYILYSEGFFDTLKDTPQGKIEPFEMKCEAGKCAAGKCASEKTNSKSMKCETGKCASGKCAGGK